jgi:hypothetical protein
MSSRKNQPSEMYATGQLTYVLAPAKPRPRRPMLNATVEVAVIGVPLRR